MKIGFKAVVWTNSPKEYSIRICLVLYYGYCYDLVVVVAVVVIMTRLSSCSFKVFGVALQHNPIVTLTELHEVKNYSLDTMEFLQINSFYILPFLHRAQRERGTKMHYIKFSQMPTLPISPKNNTSRIKEGSI